MRRWLGISAEAPCGGTCPDIIGTIETALWSFKSAFMGEAEWDRLAAIGKHK